MQILFELNYFYMAQGVFMNGIENSTQGIDDQFYKDA